MQLWDSGDVNSWMTAVGYLLAVLAVVLLVIGISSGQGLLIVAAIFIVGGNVVSEMRSGQS
jgi:hypothetical protein